MAVTPVWDSFARITLNTFKRAKFLCADVLRYDVCTQLLLMGKLIVVDEDGYIGIYELGVSIDGHENYEEWGEDFVDQT